MFGQDGDDEVQRPTVPQFASINYARRDVLHRVMELDAVLVATVPGGWWVERGVLRDVHGEFPRARGQEYFPPEALWCALAALQRAGDSEASKAATAAVHGQEHTRREPAPAPSARPSVVGSFLLSPLPDTRAGHVSPDRPRVTAPPRRQPTPLAAGWGDSTT